MKKQQLLFLLIAYALSVTQIFAQENAEKQSRFDNAPEPQRRRWELGVDLLNLINRNSNANDVQGELYKQGYLIIKRYSMNKINKSALEMRLGIYTSDVTLKNNYSNDLNIVNQNYNLTFGYEFQKQQGRFMLIYGPQIKTIFKSNTINSLIVNPLPTNGEYTSSKSNGSYISGGGFIGARFFFNSRLSVSISTNLEIGSDLTKTNTKIFNSTSNLLIQEANDSRNSTEILGGQITTQIGFHF